jgi:hypothetical protein
LIFYFQISLVLNTTTTIIPIIIISVGYGDITPTNDKERVFCIVLEGVGCVMYALIVATLTSVIMTKDANKRAMSEKLGNISSYVVHRGFNPQVTQII